MPVYNMVSKMVRYLMGKSGKIKPDGSGGLYEPLFRLAQDGYFKGLHGYLYQNPAPRKRAAPDNRPRFANQLWWLNATGQG
jgi:hypothetical protein